MEVHYSKQAIKFLAKQEQSVRDRIKRAIKKLPAGDVVRLSEQPYYRLRIGGFRVLFSREGEIIAIAKIENRGQVYQKRRM